MDDAVFVGVLERAGDLRREGHRLVHRKLLFPVDSISECFALHERHHVEEEAVRVAGVV